MTGPTLWTVLRLLLAASLAIGTSRGLRFALAVIPMEAARRRALQQAFPAVELLLGALLCGYAVRDIFHGDPLFTSIGILSGGIIGLWLIRHLLSDVIVGVLLRAGSGVAVGDRIAVGDLAGRVVAMGVRVLTIETRTGDQALIPYGDFSQRAVVRTARADGAIRHAFTLEGVYEPDAVRRRALLCHWSSVQAQPIVEPTDGGLAVTVFALEADRAAEIEAFVRAGFGGG